MKLDKEANALHQLTRGFLAEVERHQELCRRFIRLSDEAAGISQDMHYFIDAESRFHYRGKASSSQHLTEL